MRRTKRGRTVALLAVSIVTVGVIARSAAAAPIPIAVPNAGFEDRATFDPFDDGVDKYNQWALEAWRHFEVDNNGGPLRIWNPGDPAADPPVVTQGIADVGFGGVAPEGDYVVVVRSRYNDDEFHDPPQVRDFEAATQLLAETFDPAMTYTLTAEVGRLVGSDYYTPLWYGYALQLAVGGTNVDGATYAGRVDGGTVIAEDSNSVTVPEDTFVTATVTYTPDPANADLAGLPLQIRLCALEDPADHSLTTWVAFDDVQLTVEASGAGAFNRGDVNIDGAINIADAIALLSHLFGGDPAPACPDAADSNDDGHLDIADAIALLSHLFGGSGPLPDPFGECGVDPTADELACESFPPCQE